MCLIRRDIILSFLFVIHLIVYATGLLVGMHIHCYLQHLKSQFLGPGYDVPGTYLVELLKYAGASWSQIIPAVLSMSGKKKRKMWRRLLTYQYILLQLYKFLGLWDGSKLYVAKILPA